MKNPITQITHYTEYTKAYKGLFANYFQIHFFSLEEIFSGYYDPKYFKKNGIKKIAKEALRDLRKESHKKIDVSLFESNGKFLISEDSRFLNPGKLIKLNEGRNKYEFNSGLNNFISFLGDAKVDVFIKNALITVGAEELFTVIEPHVKRLRIKQKKELAVFQKLRELDMTNPLLKLEVYKIEKNYIPVKIDEFLCNDFDTAFSLPERYKIGQYNPGIDRMTYILREISSGKILLGGIEEAIEEIKRYKLSVKESACIDIKALHRMELDKNNPDYLSFEEYVGVENEEGDYEYSPF